MKCKKQTLQSRKKNEYKSREKTEMLSVKGSELKTDPVLQVRRKDTALMKCELWCRGKAQWGSTMNFRREETSLESF